MTALDDAASLAGWAARRLDLALAATGGPWKPLAGGVVAPSDADNPAHSDPENLAHYGGQLIGESMVAHNVAWVVDARTALPAAAEAIWSVLDLHEPTPDSFAPPSSSGQPRYVCTQCGENDGDYQEWPCLTVQAIAQEIGGASDE